MPGLRAGADRRTPSDAVRLQVPTLSGAQAFRRQAIRLNPAMRLVLGFSDGTFSIVIEIDRWIARSSALVPHLQGTLARGGALLGVFTGVALLAAAGCLDGRRFAAPWPFFVSVMRHASAPGAGEADAVDWTETTGWTSDRRVWTCASPVAATEAVLDLIGASALRDLASAARDVLIPDPLRQAVTVVHARAERARLARDRLPHGAVERARRWLVQHLAEPYDARALARAAATSPRTLAAPHQ